MDTEYRYHVLLVKLRWIGFWQLLARHSILMELKGELHQKKWVWSQKGSLLDRPIFIFLLWQFCTSDLVGLRYKNLTMLSSTLTKLILSWHPIKCIRLPSPQTRLIDGRFWQERRVYWMKRRWWSTCIYLLHPLWCLLYKLCVGSLTVSQHNQPTLKLRKLKKTSQLVALFHFVLFFFCCLSVYSLTALFITSVSTPKKTPIPFNF